MKMVAKFSKTQDIRYCSHLDLQNLFMRAIARGKIPVQYSQGFNRHPNISMAMALSVGLQSVSEYLEVELSEPMSEAEFMEKMNASLPKDVQIMDCKYIEGKFPALMSLVYSASYTLTFQNNLDLVQMSHEIIKKDAIIIEKKTKSKTVPTDIRPLILDIKAEGAVVFCALRCGEINLKPQDLCKLYGEGNHCKILRTGLFTRQEDGSLTELMDYKF